MHLETERLLLVPTPLHVLQTRLERTDFTANVDMPGGPMMVHFPAEWPGDALVTFEHKIVTFDPARPTWGGTLVHKADRRAIGQLSFKGGPDEQGTVELGYGLNPAYHSQGYATEMVRAMLAFARSHPEVRQVTAETRVDNLASMRVLEKTGFVRAGARWCDEDGALIRWALPD
ncbi:GNAT family N-acetyltransferase [Deinococcus pimensis]|uniref:GNAT family N-acetyltransferase n=1 Tax=Deinococcus pimensis TaxID=309888 RepID=UPI000482693A|nr:GNAT family N-acetyltransferase [Deinococcus pimensis]